MLSHFVLYKMVVEVIFFKENSMSIWGEILGYLAGIGTAIAFLPQTIQTIKEK